MTRLQHAIWTWTALALLAAGTLLIATGTGG